MFGYLRPLKIPKLIFNIFYVLIDRYILILMYYAKLIEGRNFQELVVESLESMAQSHQFFPAEKMLPL